MWRVLRWLLGRPPERPISLRAELLQRHEAEEQDRRVIDEIRERLQLSEQEVERMLQERLPRGHH